MIPRLLFAVLLLLTAVGCGNRYALPEASGPLRQLNIGKWVPAPNEVATPPQVVPPTSHGDRA